MKKILAFVFVLAMLVNCLAGCAPATAPAPAAAPAEAAAPAPAAEPAAEPAAAEPAEAAAPAEEQKDYPYMCTVIRSLSNPYHQQVIEGVKLYAKKMGIPEEKVLTIAHENNSEQMLRDMQALITKYDGNIVFQVDPSQQSDFIAIAEMMENAGVYWVSIWKLPEQLNIDDYKYWVSAFNFSDYDCGYYSLKALIEWMGGEGELWILDGTNGNAAAINRREGVDACLKEYPNVKLVGYEDCSWEKTKGFNSANNAISANPNLKGIWAANDNMGVGAAEALRAKNMLGKVGIAAVNAIPDMLNLIKSGDAVATISTDPYWQGGMSMSMCVDAFQGKYVPSEEAPDHRYWMIKVEVVNKDNVESFMDTSTINIDYTDYFGNGKYLGSAR